MAKRQIKIVYQTIDNQWHETEVDEEKAAETIERLRGLPDVKSHTVKMSM